MATPRSYEIRLFDRTLVEFSITDAAFEQRVAVDDYDRDALQLMPCGLSLDSDGVWRWLEIRSIPANRRNAARICRELGFALGDLEALYRTSLGLSLNDSYWVVPRGFHGKFADYNLFENSFSEAIGALAVAGEVREGSLAGNTPELTTDGTLRKGWRIVDGRRMLYKGASEGFVPGEPLSEYLASLVARDLGLNAVGYGLDTWQGEQCSTCINFATKDVSYVPFAIATGMTNLAGALWWCSCMGDACLDAFCNMLAFDALVCNTDRHLANFGILRDNSTGRAVGLAPIFDNGRAFFPNVAEDSPEQFLLETQLRGPAFGGASFEEQLGRFMGQAQVELLLAAAQRGIVGNVFASGSRVFALDAYMRKRAENLAQISVVDRNALIASLEVAKEQWELESADTFRLASTA